MAGRSSDERDRDPRGSRPPQPPGDEPTTDAGTWSPEEDLGEPEIAEAVGETVEQAIANALEILRASEDEVDIEILQEGRRGFLGLGKGRPFRVRITWREDLDEEVIEEEIPVGEVASSRGPDDDDDEEPVETSPRRPQTPRFAERPPAPAPSAEAPAAPPRQAVVRASRAEQPLPAGSAPESLVEIAGRVQEITRDLMRRMGIEASVTSSAGLDEVRVEIQSEEDDAILIGRRGETRAALQHVIQRLALPRDDRGITLLLDVNGYWARRRDELREEALAIAEEVAREGEEIRTEPLSAQERRIVHRALADDDRVRTESIGTGALKRIAILPAVRR